MTRTRFTGRGEGPVRAPRASSSQPAAAGPAARAVITRARGRSTAPAAGLPGWLFIPAALGLTFIVLPLAALAVRVPWGSFWSLLTTQASLDALRLSLFTATTSTACCLVVGVPLAVVLARCAIPGLRVLRALVLVPLVLPPVVAGIALLSTFGRRGLLGGWFEVLGVRVAFSTTAVVLAQVFVALPFLVMSLEGALRSETGRPEAVAATLGATPTTVLARVTIPRMAPAVGTGAVLSFARSLGEFGATLTFAGSLQGVTRTLPLEIYLARETDADAAVALSLVLVAVALAVVVVAYGRQRWRNA